MTIRCAVLEDIPHLTELFRAQSQLQRKLSDYFELREDADCAAFLASRIAAADARILVEERHGEIVGYLTARIVRQPTTGARGNWSLWRKWFNTSPQEGATVFKARRYGIVEDWYVVEGLRRIGIGRALWNRNLDWLRQNGVQEIEVTVLAANESARRLFRGLGMQLVREQLRATIQPE